MEVLGVDEHVWRHTRRGDRYVTVIIDLTPVRDRSGPARLLDVVPGRSKKVLKTWLSQRDQDWRGRVEVVAMDGFTGFKSAAGEELPQARAVMDPFHVVSLAASKLDQCRRRIQRAITGRRGRAGDRLYRARRTLLTEVCLLTDTQAERFENLFADERHAAVQASWGVYQRLIQAYCTEDPGPGKHLMQRLIDSLKQAVLALAHRCILPRTPRPATTSSKTHSHLTHHIRIPKPKKFSPHSATHLRHPKRHDSGSTCRWDDHRARSAINDQRKFTRKFTSVSRSCSTLNGFIGRNCYRYLKREFDECIWVRKGCNGDGDS